MAKVGTTLLEHLRATGTPDEDLREALTRTRDELSRMHLRRRHYTNQAVACAAQDQAARTSRATAVLRGRVLGLETQAKKSGKEAKS